MPESPGTVQCPLISNVEFRAKFLTIGSGWQFWIKGKGRMTVFNAQESARTMDSNANDVGFVPKMAGHSLENTGDEDIVFLEIFATGKFQDISLNQWLRALPAHVALAHLNLSPEELGKFPQRLKRY